jgi:hypothetical protein
MIIVGAMTRWARHGAMPCGRCGRSTWVDRVLLDHARLHREEAEIVCESCHRRGPSPTPADRLTLDHEEAEDER